MKFNTFVFPFVVLAIVSAGCSRDSITPDGDRGVTKVTVSVSAGDMTTKAEIQTSEEKSISSLDVLVFDSDGNLEASEHTTGALTTSPMALTQDEKTVYAFANLPSGIISTLTTKAACESYHATLAQNTPSSFFMKGKTVETVGPTTYSIAVSISRDVFKVVMAAAPSFSGTAAGGVLNAVYLINVPKTFSAAPSYTMSDGAQLWNFDGAVAGASEQDALLKGTTWSASLYGYPNASAEAAAVTEKDAITKIVLKCTVGGKTQWYPIALRAIAANKRYVVNGVNINGLGSTEPNGYVGHDVLSVTVSDLDWEEGEITSSYLSEIIPPKPKTFGGLQITPGPLAYESGAYVIKDDWNHDSYNSIYGKSEGSTYFNFIQMGQLFEKAGFGRYDEHIDNTLDPFDGWRLPTRTELERIVGSTRDGSTVNGTPNVRYALVELTGVTHAGSYTPSGLLLFPDGETITGKTLNAVNSTGYTSGITNSELNVYIEQGCAFIPSSGYYYSSWQMGGICGRIWSSTEYDYSNWYAYMLSVICGGGYTRSVSGDSSDHKSDVYQSVRLVKESL